MNTTEMIHVDMTSPELHKLIKQYQVRNPGIADLSTVMELAINERWPGAQVEGVLRQAEINWLSQDSINRVRDTARNMEEWIDTGLQGDLFNDIPMSVPKLMLKDGKPVEYWKCSLPEMREYMASLASSTQVQAQALQDALSAKLAAVDNLKRQISNIDEAIRRAKAQGIDPETVRYVKAG